MIVQFAVHVDPFTVNFFMDSLGLSLSLQQYVVCELLVSTPELATDFICWVSDHGGEFPFLTLDLFRYYSEGTFSSYELLDGSIRLLQLLQPSHSFYLDQYTIPWNWIVEDLARARLDAFSAGLDSIGLREVQPLTRSSRAPNLFLIEESDEEPLLSPTRVMRSSSSTLSLFRG